MYRILITPEMSLYEALRTVAEKYPARPAVTFRDRTITYRDLLGQVETLALRLQKRKLEPGSRIALLLPNSLGYVCAFLAPAALGAVIIPLDLQVKARDLNHILKDSGCSHVLADLEILDCDTRTALQEAGRSAPGGPRIFGTSELRFEPEGEGGSQSGSQRAGFPPVSPDSPAAFFYTSGTTGVPKAVVHSHRTLLSALTQGPSVPPYGKLQQIARFGRLIIKYKLRDPGAVFRQITSMSPAPFHLLLGFGPLFGALFMGSRFVVCDGYHPGRILELIEKERVGFLIASPTMLLALLKSREFGKRDLSSLWLIMITSALCPPELADRVEKEFRSAVIIGFGATELGGSAVQTSVFDSRKQRRETVGRSTGRSAGKIVDEERRSVPPGQIGELAQRIPSVMLGYHNAPELTAEAMDADGWYYTGDLAVMDEKGFVRIVGRKKDMVIRGGQNIFPAEVERFVLGLEGVKNAAGVGRPDPVLGEGLWLFVELEPGAAWTAESLLAHCRGHLAPAKRPDHVKIVDSLPLTASGKVRKFLLKEMDVSHE